MTLEEAAEVLMVSKITLDCPECFGRGTIREAFCKMCNGARIILNPIWQQAWLVVHPEDYAGMTNHRAHAIRELWRKRKLYS